MAAGFILNATGPSTIRLAPPLVLTEADAQALIDAWPAILDASEVPAMTRHLLADDDLTPAEQAEVLRSPPR